MTQFKEHSIRSSSLPIALTLGILSLEKRRWDLVLRAAENVGEQVTDIHSLALTFCDQ
jgi:hypothetical protein